MAGVDDLVASCGRGVAWGDYDNDGFLDLFVTNGEDNTQFTMGPQILSQRAVNFPENYTHGVTISARMANGWPTHSKAVFAERRWRKWFRWYRAGKIIPAKRLRPLQRGRQRVEWCSDWYRADYYAQLAAQGSVARNTQGPRGVLSTPRRGRRIGASSAAARLFAPTNIARATW